jgi:probable F420-dependent oxidoreductase
MEESMDFGASMFFTEYSMTAAELGWALEARGFESVWAPEHSDIPSTRRTPPAGGGELGEQYYDVMEPFVTLTAAAMATKNLKVATGVCLITQRDTIQTAKLVASIDQVSGGRFLFGVGVGWNQDEIESHGTVFKTRFKKMREQIEAMKEIWTRSEPEYPGEIVDVPKMRTWPKPVQKPHPPVIVGGAFPQSARRAIRYGDGWVPNASRSNYADVTEFLPQFRQMAAEAGRDLTTLPITIFGEPRSHKAVSRPGDCPRRGASALGTRCRDPSDTRPLGAIDPPDRPLIAKTHGPCPAADRARSGGWKVLQTGLVTESGPERVRVAKFYRWHAAHRPGKSSAI